MVGGASTIHVKCSFWWRAIVFVSYTEYAHTHTHTHTASVMQLAQVCKSVCVLGRFGAGDGFEGSCASVRLKRR